MPDRHSQFARNERHRATADFPRVIRRDLPGKTDQKPRIVPWLGHKIARAVDAACAAVNTDKMLGAQVRGEIEFRMNRDRPLFVHIEQLQDTVEDTLLELGHPRVALAYAKYRGKRSAMRELELGEPEDDDQLELVSTEQIADIRERVSFAKIGLNLTLSGWRTDYPPASQHIRGSCPQPNDATPSCSTRAACWTSTRIPRFFAGRILLTFIYEETLPWKITDGIGKLKEAHQKGICGLHPTRDRTQATRPASG